VPRTYDYIVVGAGTAGCVLANRLTGHPATSVLMLEAGAGFAADAVPADIADTYPSSYFNRSYFWPGLKAHWRNRTNSHEVGLSQGRGLGGGGAVMGMIALRGVPNDYDDWERAGAEGWGWHDVLPYFCRLESDRDFRGDQHGDAGPIPIRRTPREHWPAFARAVEDYARTRNLPFIADMNADFRDGYCSIPISASAERRAASVLCYLDGPVRARPNLQVVTQATVTRIVFEGRRAVGVRARVDGAEQEFRAGEVILAGGAIFSPAILMRSGVGPGAALAALGIPVVADRPGVGANLQNHANLFIGMHLKRDARHGDALRTVPMISLRLSSGRPGCPQGDLYVNVQTKTSWNALGEQIGNIAPTLLRPDSRGSVALTTADPLVQPRIEFNFLDTESDLERMMQVFICAVDIALHDRVRALSGTPFPVRYTDRLRVLNERNRANEIKTSLIAGLLDAVPGLNDLVLGTLTGKRVDLRALADDPDRLAQHIRENVGGVFHPTGTCRMGRPDDPGAVVDPRGLVYGVENLRVADAGIMPNVMSANTNIPTIMTAEKIADGILAAAG